MFLGCSSRVKILELFDLTTLALIVFEWLKRVEPNSAPFYNQIIRSKLMHPWASAAMFSIKTTQNFAYPFQVGDDAM